MLAHILSELWCNVCCALMIVRADGLHLLQQLNSRDGLHIPASFKGNQREHSHEIVVLVCSQISLRTMCSCYVGKRNTHFGEGSTQPNNQATWTSPQVCGSVGWSFAEVICRGCSITRVPYTGRLLKRSTMNGALGIWFSALKCTGHGGTGRQPAGDMWIWARG